MLQRAPDNHWMGYRYDVCNDCWKDALEYIKWKMTPGDADHDHENG